MIFFRLYLLAGLIAHKVLWEVLKKRAANPAFSRPSQSLSLVKAVKVAILLGIVAQTLLPELLPITSDPWILRITGVTIYTAGLAIAMLGRIQLGENWSDIEEGQVLRNQAVISRGIYSYVRHPIYVGDLLLLLGLELALNSWLVLGVLLLAPVVLVQALREEEKLLHKLDGYPAYCSQTKRFIPYIV